MPHTSSVFTSRTSSAGAVLPIKPSHAKGSYATFVGKIAARKPKGNNGNELPEGKYLVLPTSIEVGGCRAKELFLGYTKLPAGSSVALNGRLEVDTIGSGESQVMYLALSGVSNLSAGEPKFNGKTFTDAKGNQLRHINLPYPQFLEDAPSRIMVLSHDAKKAFVGSMGGYMPQWANPFHGFLSARKMSAATAQDRARVAMGATGVVRNSKTGEELEALGKEGARGSASWFYDKSDGKAYRFGGVQGNTLELVVKFQKGDLQSGIAPF